MHAYFQCKIRKKIGRSICIIPTVDGCDLHNSTKAKHIFVQLRKKEEAINTHTYTFSRAYLVCAVGEVPTYITKPMPNTLP